VDPLGALASRGGVDVDLALERVVGIRQPQLALAAAEQGLEDAQKVALDGGEGLEKEAPGRGRGVSSGVAKACPSRLCCAGVNARGPSASGYRDIRN
jgi:hypothetical protein